MPIKLKNEDCNNFIKKIPSNSINLILTDPPYIISRDTGFKSKGKKGVERLRISMDFGQWDKIEDLNLESLLNECNRVLTKGGTIIIFYDLWKIQELKEALTKAKFEKIRFLEWVKTNPVPINARATYLSNSREVAVSAVKKGKATFNSYYDNGIYNYPIEHSKDRFHSTQKSLDLFTDLVIKHSNEGDTVMDLFSGSSTTAIACIKTGRRFVGCELDEVYFKKSKIRINYWKLIINLRNIIYCLYKNTLMLKSLK